MTLGKVAHALTCPQDAEANSLATIAIHGLKSFESGPLPSLAFGRYQRQT